MISFGRRTRTAFAVLVASLLAAGACQRNDSYLLVEVAGDLTLAPVQMRVSVFVGPRSSTFFVPPEPTPISLPTSFTVELDRSITGPVTVTVEALDDASVSLAWGETTQAHINTGGETIVVVTLVAGPPP